MVEISSHSKLEENSNESHENAIKYFSRSEFESHNTEDSLWLLIHDKIYDVTKFKEEHPGGEEVLIESAGMDATDNFEDVGHSADARQLMKEYCIGELKLEDRIVKNKPTSSTKTQKSKSTNRSKDINLPLIVLLGLGLIGALVAFFLFYYTKSSHKK